MAFDKTPTTWLANWSEDGTDITVPVATFTELTAAEADAANGDIRKIVFALLEHLYQGWIGTASADRPVKWTMSKTATINAVNNAITSRYVVTLITDIGTQEVREEYSASPSASISSSPSASVSSSPSSSPSASKSTSPSASKSTSPSASKSTSPSASKSSSPSAS